MAITNKEINLAQLDRETGGKGLIGDFNDSNKKQILPADNNNLSESGLEAAIATHVATETSEPTVSQKLASVGLSVDDLKAALGL